MYDPLVETYPIISDQMEKRELSIVLQKLRKILDTDVPGDIVEFGCYVGTSSLFMRRVLNAYSNSRSFHVYDSFEGLPKKNVEDQSPIGTQFVEGELIASKKVFINNFKKAGLKLPYIHKGWFKDLSAVDIPERIAFAFLDGDYYESIRVPLRLIEGRLSKGAVIIVDDYTNEALPGASRAVMEWARKHNMHILTTHSLAILNV